MDIAFRQQIIIHENPPEMLLAIPREASGTRIKPLRDFRRERIYYNRVRVLPNVMEEPCAYFKNFFFLFMNMDSL